MRRILILLTVLLLLAYLATGISTVGPDERAVVRRWGKVIDRPGPGLHVGLPWGMDRIDKFPVRAVRQLSVGYTPDDAADSPNIPAGQLLTGDQNLVNLRLVVEYALDDEHLEDYAVLKDRADGVLAREAEAAAAEWVASRTVDEVLGGRAAVARRVAEVLPARISPHRLGVVVQRVSVEHLAAPDEVRESFDAVNRAQTGIRTRVNQAEQERQRKLSEAEATRNRLKNEATAAATERTTQATAEAAAFVKRTEQYHAMREQNPDLLAALWREEVGKILAGVKERGRVEVLDDALGPNGLELNQFLPGRK
jgi:modulator of FtsH protease HflK